MNHAIGFRSLIERDPWEDFKHEFEKNIVWEQYTKPHKMI
jgi:hypothetical protein